jgi:Tat protein translocase TatB subunit
MGPIGFPELIMIFVVALLLFGPKKLPELGRTIGRAMGEFRRASNDLQRSLEDEIAATELKEAKKAVQDAISLPNEIPSLVTDTMNEIKSPLDPYQSPPPGEPGTPTEPQVSAEPTKPIEPK